MVRAATFLRKNGRQRCQSLTRAVTVDIHINNINNKLI